MSFDPRKALRTRIRTHELLDRMHSFSGRSPTLAVAAERLIAEKGIVYPYAPLPPDIKYGEEGVCFMNASHLADAFPRRFRYVEGFGFRACLGDLCLPFHHAWCIDRKNRVVDPTWKQTQDEDGPQTDTYIGIVIPPKLRHREELRWETYGVLIKEMFPNFRAIQDLGGGKFSPELLSLGEKQKGRKRA